MTLEVSTLDCAASSFSFIQFSFSNTNTFSLPSHLSLILLRKILLNFAKSLDSGLSWSVLFYPQMCSETNSFYHSLPCFPGYSHFIFLLKTRHIPTSVFSPALWSSLHEEIRILINVEIVSLLYKTVLKSLFYQNSDLKVLFYNTLQYLSFCLASVLTNSILGVLASFISILIV